MTQPPPPNRQPRTMWIALAAVAAAVVAAGVTVAVVMSTSSDEMPTASVGTGLPGPVLVTGTTAPKIVRTATATPSPDFPAGLDSRCSQAPADDVTKIQTKLKDSTQRLAHAIVLTGADGRKYLAASVVKADGALVQKSDVWAHTISSGWTAATGGARSTTTWPKTSDVVTSVDLGGEDVQTADRCAYDWAKISGYN